MYSETGAKDKYKTASDKLMKAIRTPTGSGSAWYVYGLQAEGKIIAKDYQGANQDFLNALANAHGVQRRRIGWEFQAGLKRIEINDSAEFKDTRTLLNQGKYQELDKIAAALVANKDKTWSGYWKA